MNPKAFNTLHSTTSASVEPLLSGHSQILLSSGSDHGAPEQKVKFLLPDLLWDHNNAAASAWPGTVLQHLIHSLGKTTVFGKYW